MRVVVSIIALSLSLPGAPLFAQTGAAPATTAPSLETGVLESELGTQEADSTKQQVKPTRADAERSYLQTLVEKVNHQRHRGVYAQGLADAREGLERARKLGDLRLQIEFLYLRGRMHWNLSDYPHSVESHLEELKLAEKLGDYSLLARTHAALGSTYLRFGQTEDALFHFKQGLELVRKTDDKEQLGNLLNNLGNYYITIRDFDRAQEIHLQALKLREQQGNKRGIADSLTNLGLVAEARHQYATALDYLHRALAIYQPLGLKRYLANTHRRIATTLRSSGRADEALPYLKTALLIAEPLGSPEVLATIYQELALTQEARGEFAEALRYERLRAQENEVIRNEQDRLRMDELRTRYAAEQRELEITLLKREQELQTAEIRRRRFQNIAVIAGLGLGLAVLSALFLVQWTRLKTARKLHSATDEARTRAEQAERLKSRLLLMASHDLKVPLTALNATADLIAKTADDPASVKRLAESMSADTAHMRTLVRDFLDAVAIEDGNLQIRPALLNLSELAGAVVETLQTVAATKAQTLALHTSSSPLSLVHADGNRLRQIFENLVGNALKFTPRQGSITVTLGQEQGWVFCEIKDTGPGLTPADFAKIFAPFQSLSAKPTGVGDESTGLGLFIARELLALQGGKLEVQSQPGHGAVFRVLLPAVDVRRP